MTVLLLLTLLGQTFTCNDGSVYQCPAVVEPPPPPPVVTSDCPEPAVGGSIQQVSSGLQTAINNAASGDVLHIAGGIYPGPFAWTGKALTLCGGWAPDFSSRDVTMWPTVLQGPTSMTVVTIRDPGRTALLGLTVMGGAQGVLADTYWPNLGPIIVEDCTFEGNAGGSNRGAGLQVKQMPLVVRRSTVRNNIGLNGAGIGTSRLPSFVLEDSLIEGNVSNGDHGGGVFIEASNVIVRRNTFRNNSIARNGPYGWGGAFIFAGPEGAVGQFDHNVVTGNFAHSTGAGEFYDGGTFSTVEFDLVYANSCPRNGGAGIYVDGGGGVTHVTARNVTVTGHNCPTSQNGGGGVYASTNTDVTVEDSIFWNNSDDFYQGVNNGHLVVTSSICAENWPGCTYADPLFDTTYHLRSGSPAVGLGAFP